MKWKQASFGIIVFFTLIELVIPLTPAAGAMSSTNYYIYSDAIGLSGNLSTSTDYSLQDSTGVGPSNFVTSTNYTVSGGYQYAELGTLSLTIGTSAVSLGTLSTTTVQSGSSVVTIDTNSWTGYTLSISSVSGSGLHGVTDGSVTVGVEEYGIALSGAHRAFSDDEAITANLVLASTTNSASNDPTTITFKAAISSTSTSGSYSQTITLTASANL